MIFTEAIFPLFLGIVLFVYWVVLRGDWRNHWLLLASAVFYGWWDAKLLLLIGAVIGVSWLAALMIRRREGDRRGQLIVLWLAIGFQLSMLGVFKYFNFFTDSFTDFAATHV